MNTFDFQFTVNAPRALVAAFHHDTRILKKLSPPPMFVQIHSFEPLADRSLADFTLWFGPIPLRWRARHSNVSESGFTDTQEEGPMAYWQHRHQFESVGPTHTIVREHIQYEHPAGLKGLFTRMLFNPAGLYLLFTYRKLRTRWEVSRHESATAQQTS